MATNIIASVGAARCLHIQGPQVRQPQLQLRSRKKASGRARAVSEIVEASQSVQAAPELTWQIWAGAIAGVTPFVVAGIEFSKRIAAQQRCSVCGGSGLVKKSGSYFRCGNCGKFPLKEDSYRGTRGKGFSKDDRNAPSSNFLVRPTSSWKV